MNIVCVVWFFACGFHLVCFPHKKWIKTITFLAAGYSLWTQQFLHFSKDMSITFWFFFCPKFIVQDISADFGIFIGKQILKQTVSFNICLGTSHLHTISNFWVLTAMLTINRSFALLWSKMRSVWQGQTYP